MQVPELIHWILLAEKWQTFFYNISRALIGRESLSTKVSRPLKRRYNGTICCILSLGRNLPQTNFTRNTTVDEMLCHYCHKRENIFLWAFLALTQRHTALLNRICYQWWDRPDQPDPVPFFTKAAPVWVIIKSWLNWLPSLFFKFSFGGVFMWQGRSVASIYAHKPCLHVKLKYGKIIFFYFRKMHLFIIKSGWQILVSPNIGVFVFSISFIHYSIILTASLAFLLP